jgi:hypothetical protein
VGLFVASGFKDLDLSQLVMRFSVTMTGSEAANTASIRVYDLASGMAKRIQKDYQSVMLQAGHSVRLPSWQAETLMGQAIDFSFCEVFTTDFKPQSVGFSVPFFSFFTLAIISRHRFSTGSMISTSRR